MNDYGKKNNLLKNDEKGQGDDCREGLTAVISVKLTEAQFEGPTKAKLGNSAIRTLVDNIVSDKLTEFWKKIRPSAAQSWTSGHSLAGREAARKARENIRRKNALEGMHYPASSPTAHESDPSLTEIYIVEGDSGAAARRAAGQPFFSHPAAVGKMLNVEKARADKVYGNDKLTPVITALGAASARISTTASSGIIKSSSWPTPTSTAATSGRSC